MIVHVLHHGRSLCGLPGVPRDWPEGNRWVGLQDRASANCPSCLAAARLAAARWPAGATRVEMVSGDVYVLGYRVDIEEIENPIALGGKEWVSRLKREQGRDLLTSGSTRETALESMLIAVRAWIAEYGVAPDGCTIPGPDYPGEGAVSRVVMERVVEICLHCDEPILDGDQPSFKEVCHIDRDGGAKMRRQHYECFMRAVVGSVGHQNGTCSCHGGTVDDPPGMTKRQAAQAAVDIFRSTQGLPPMDWTKRDPWTNERTDDAEGSL